MDLSLEEMIQSQINQISTSEQLKDFIEQHSHDISAFCKALESQIAYAMHGQREAIMAFVLYYFGYMQNLDRIGKLIADGCVSFFVMDVCEPVCIGGKPLITKQQLANMVHVVAPYLEKVTEKESEKTLEFCIRYAFEIAKPYIAHLRQHEDYSIARTVIDAYRAHNCDEGTFDIIEQYYYRTGKSGFTEILRYWVGKGDAESIHQNKISQVAFNILSHAFRYSNISTNQASNIHVENLLFAIAACPPQGAINLVYDMLNCAELHIKFRVEAMVYYFDFTNKIPEQREQLIRALFSDNRENKWGSESYPHGKVDDLSNLTERNLVILEDLLSATLTDTWGYEAVKEIERLPNKQQNRQLIVSEVIRALRIILKELSSLTGDGFRYRYSDFDVLLYKIINFELSTDQKNTIGDLLQEAIQDFRKNNVDMPRLAIGLNSYLVRLDLVHEIKDPSELSPWDAMIFHWWQQKITWRNAAQVLVDARVIPSVDYFELLKWSDLTDDQISSRHRYLKFQFLSVLEGNPPQKCCYCMFDPYLDDDHGDNFGY